jgi:hypothetical protein
VFDLDRIDGLVVLDNHGLVKAIGEGIDVGSSTNVVIAPAEGVQFPFSP